MDNPLMCQDLGKFGPTRRAWECPRCHTIYAPWVESCKCCASQLFGMPVQFDASFPENVVLLRGANGTVVFIVDRDDRIVIERTG